MASCKYYTTVQYRAVQYYTNTDRWWVQYEFYMTEEKFILPEAKPRAIWIFSRSYKIHIAQTTGPYLFYYMTWEDVMINNKKSIARARNISSLGLNVVFLTTPTARKKEKHWWAYNTVAKWRCKMVYNSMMKWRNELPYSIYI